MSFILDTSIWIEYFKGNHEYFDICQGYLEKGEIKAVEIIFAELLQGARNKREVETIKAYYELLPKIEISGLYLLAGEYSKDNKLFNKGIGLIDSCIIIATIKSQSKLWTLDKKIKDYLEKEYLFIN